MIIAFLLVFFLGLLMMAGYEFTNVMAVTTFFIISIIGVILFVAVHEKRRQARR